VAALNRRALAGALLVALAGPGCASFARLDSPRTVRPRSRDVLVAPSAYVGPRKDGNAFNTDVVLRWGVADRADVGMRLSLVGYAADVKFQLVRADDPTRGVDVAIAPSVGGGADISFSTSGTGGRLWAWQASLPLLVGINLGSAQLVITPQLLYESLPVLPAGILNAGGTVAIGPMSGRGFSVYPVVAIWKALDARHPIGSLDSPGTVAIQPSLVFRFGQ